MTSAIRKILLKLKWGGRLEIGPGVTIGKGLNLLIKESAKISLMDRVTVRDNVNLRAMGSSRLVIMEGSVIDDNVRIISANDTEIVLKKNVKIGKNGVLNGGGGIEIGQNTSFYGNVLVASSAHDMSSGADFRSVYVHAKVNIGENCLIGANSVIMPGSNIPDNTCIEHLSKIS